MQTLIAFIRKSFSAAQTDVARQDAVRTIGAAELRQVVGGANVSLPRTGW